MELGQGCEIEVKIPTDPERDLRLPGPGTWLRERWGWKPLLHTLTSGIWVLPGAFVSRGGGGGVEELLDSEALWERRGSYRTAWAVPSLSGCQCSYSYGQGPAIGPHTGRGCFRILSSVWRALAPLMSPWCADGDVPAAANLSLYGGSKSHVAWHCDDESLFGGNGDPKLIVSLSLGSSVTFKWKAKSCSDSEASSCRLHHGDLLVMDGRCQDEYLHCTSPGLADRRVNVTYRWIRYHTLKCHLAAGVLGSLPTCAQGSPVLGPVWGICPVPVGVLLGFLVVLLRGLLIVLPSRASRKAYHGEHISPLTQFWPLGQFRGTGHVCFFWKPWGSFSWTGRYGGIGYGLSVTAELPCMLAWLRLLSLIVNDACWVIRLTRAPG